MLEEYLSTDDLDIIQQIPDLDAGIAAAARTLIPNKTGTDWLYEHRFVEASKRERRSGMGSFLPLWSHEEHAGIASHQRDARRTTEPKVG